MSHTMDPVSPPESPITASPAGNRKPMSKIHIQHSQIRSTFSTTQRYISSDDNREIRYSIASGLVGPNGLPLRTTNLRPDEISPRSSSSSVINNIAESDMTIDIELDTEADDVGNDADEETNANDAESESDSDSDAVACDNLSKSPASVEMTDTTNASRPAPSPRHGDRLADPTAPVDTPDEEDAEAAEQMEDGTTSFTTKFYLEEEFLIIEEVSDFDSDNGRIEALLPYVIEEAESEPELPPDPKRNRSGKLNPAQARRRSSVRYARPPDLDRGVMSGLRGFSLQTGSDEEAIAEDDEDDSDFDQAEHDVFRQMLREEKRRRRLTSGSISKRTITESIGSGSDHEDCSTIDPNEAGSSARRLRRRLERHSLLFTDPPAPRIDELDEPETSDNEDDVREMTCDGESLARELPYYTLEYISIEVDSP